jgi:hypothetical protein
MLGHAANACVHMLVQCPSLRSHPGSDSHATHTVQQRQGRQAPCSNPLKIQASHSHVRSLWIEAATPRGVETYQPPLANRPPAAEEDG